MIFDLATAKTRLNIVGTTQDGEIQAALDASLAIAEAYCKRRFSYAAEIAHYYHVEAGYLFVDRYPINSVTSVVRSNGQSDVKYKVNKSSGFLDLHGCYTDEELQVTYSGGYATLPADLEYALWGIFDGVWSNMNNAGSVSAGGVDKISLVGVGSISYDTGSGASSGSAGNPVSGYAEAILSNYKRYKT